jgi:hypothetical protein
MPTRRIVYTYPLLLLWVLVRIPRILGLRFELLVQTPLESPLAAAIEALLVPILVVHAAGVECNQLKLFTALALNIYWQLGGVAWFCGSVAWLRAQNAQAAYLCAYHLILYG